MRPWRINPDALSWLEKRDSPRALAWVHAQNERTNTALTREPIYRKLYQAALTFTTARIASRVRMPRWMARCVMVGYTTFWQDEGHPHGIWRRARLRSYLSPLPKWETLLDIDQLLKAEGHEWIVYPATSPCLAPNFDRCMLQLSEWGGSDRWPTENLTFGRRRSWKEGLRFGGQNDNRRLAGREYATCRNRLG